MMNKDQIIDFVESNLHNSTTVYFMYTKPDGSERDREVLLQTPLTADDKNYKPGVNFYGIDLVDEKIKLWRFDRITDFGRGVKPMSDELKHKLQEESHRLFAPKPEEGFWGRIAKGLGLKE